MIDKIVIDPNACDFSRFLEDQSFLESQSIRPCTDFKEAVAELARHGTQLIGAKLPWGKTHERIRVGDGKLSVWAGTNGSGKSLMLGQVITNLMEQGRTACIASLEMRPEQTLHRMITQSATCNGSPEYSNGWLDYFAGRLFVYDQLDSIASDRILAMAHYAAYELGAKDIVIDSLTKCGVGKGKDDYNAQHAFIDRLQWCAKRWRVHVHLICHMKKQQGVVRTENKYDIGGSGSITDLADNVYILRRNKAKEVEAEKQREGKEYSEDKLLQPCAVLAIEKNRDYGHEFEVPLWYHHESGQFMGSPGAALPPLELF